MVSFVSTKDALRQSFSHSLFKHSCLDMNTEATSKFVFGFKFEQRVPSSQLNTNFFN